MSCFIIIHQQVLYLFWRHGPRGLRGENKGEDKIIIATPLYPFQHFPLSSEFIKNKSSTPLITTLNLWLTPLLSTDCSVINIRGFGDVDAAAAFLHLILSLEQNRRKWTIQTDKCVPFRVKAKDNAAAHLFWGITNKTLVQFFQGVSSGTTRLLVSKPYQKCSIWQNHHFANVSVKVLSHPLK